VGKDRLSFVRTLSGKEDGPGVHDLGAVPLNLGQRVAMTNHPIGHALTKLGEWATHPAAFGLALLYAAAWLLFDRESFDFQGATELIVLIMTLFIVR
jgi:hypothetical protein